jgi:hypothetical protein
MTPSMSACPPKAKEGSLEVWFARLSPHQLVLRMWRLDIKPLMNSTSPECKTEKQLTTAPEAEIEIFVPLTHSPSKSTHHNLPSAPLQMGPLQC